MWEDAWWVNMYEGEQMVATMHICVKRELKNMGVVVPGVPGRS